MRVHLRRGRALYGRLTASSGVIKSDASGGIPIPGNVTLGSPVPEIGAPVSAPASDRRVEHRGVGQARDRLCRLFAELAGAHRAEFVLSERPDGSDREGWLEIPILIREQHMGTAYFWRNGPPFDPEEIDRIRVLVPLAAGALQILEGSSAVAVSDLRVQLASQLHEGPAQRLSHAQMELHLLRRSQNDPQTREVLRRLQGLLDGAARSLRDAIADLRDRRRRAFDLSVVLETIATQIRAGGLRVDLDLAGEERLPSATAQVLAHVGVEAMINAFKHADAKAITVRLRASEGLAVLEVADDGRGLSGNGVRGPRGRRSFGLSLMRSQVQGVGGIFEAQSLDEGGTIVRAAVPLR